MIPAAEALARFAADLDALVPLGERVGIAVSGGPDSLALLLLAAAARPGLVEAATVDHRLRANSAHEAALVAGVCVGLGVPHHILVADWHGLPTANLQAEARAMRYRLLGEWASGRSLAAIATAHHADDQAETLMMRLARGAGISGLSGARQARPVFDNVQLVRPLLGWRHSELVGLVDSAEIEPVDDPSNHDPRHDRTRIRQWLAETDWIDPARLAVSAAALREAEEALDWAFASLIEGRLVRDGAAIVIDPSNLPREMTRRLLLAAFDKLDAAPPRGPDLARAMAALTAGKTITLSGLRLEGGPRWRLSSAPPHRS